MGGERGRWGEEVGGGRWREEGREKVEGKEIMKLDIERDNTCVARE